MVVSFKTQAKSQLNKIRLKADMHNPTQQVQPTVIANQKLKVDTQLKNRAETPTASPERMKLS